MSNWGTDDKQAHYRQGRDLREIKKTQIAGICKCGYLTLNPTSDFERHNGGLTVKRSNVVVINDSTGLPLKQLRGVDRWYGCNACVNKWR